MNPNKFKRKYDSLMACHRTIVRTETRRDELLRGLSDVFISVFLEVLKEFNVKRKIKIKTDPPSLQLIFLKKKRAFAVKLWMHTTVLRQDPEKEFSIERINEVSKELRLILKKHFAKAKLPIAYAGWSSFELNANRQILTPAQQGQK